MPKSVRGDHRLIPFVFVPGNVARMVVTDQDHPFGPGLMMAGTSAGMAGDHCGPGFRFSERIRSCIGGVSDDGTNVLIDG